VLIELYIFAFALISYGFLITLAIIGFNKLNRTIEASKHPLNLFISIIVSARNEEQTIKDFIYEIIKQNFPKTNFELIIIDDYSNDNTYELAKETLEKSGIKYKLIKQDIHCGKKKNLALAIDKSKGDIIITTDADVIYRHPNWLQSISTYFSALSPNMLIMPVDFKSESDLLSRFQITENIALTGITAGYAGIQKPFMCNGANLAFKKNIYEEVKGYQSHIHISSGEDVFLLESFAKLDTKLIHYVLLRELIVKTSTVNNLKDLLSQRIRWASKTKENPNLLNSFFAFIVVISNLIFLALFVAILKKSVILPYLSIFALAKFVFDFLLLFLASDFLGRLKYIWWIIPFECVYWIYALSIGLTSLVYKPFWKGKKIT
jgi:cellulose synthase/poly-beta-1,6-N-acetylglucosamine synthase-like glycosyltransferase